MTRVEIHNTMDTWIVLYGGFLSISVVVDQLHMRMAHKDLL